MFCLSHHLRPESKALHKATGIADGILATLLITGVALFAIAQTGAAFEFLNQSEFLYLAVVFGTIAAGIVIADGVALIRREDNTSENRTEDLSSQSEQEHPEAVVYMSISGNPTHLGHVEAINEAASKIREIGYRVSKVYLSVAHQSYVRSKVHSRNQTIQRTSQKFVSFDLKSRQEIARKVIRAAEKTNLIAQGAVQFLNDQVPFPEDGLLQEAPQGNAEEHDHPETLRRLIQENPEARVFMVTGSDFWETREGTGVYRNKRPYIDHTIIFAREDANIEAIKNGTRAEGKTRLVFPAPKSNYSSSKIQKGELLMPTEELQQMLESKKREAVS